MEGKGHEIQSLKEVVKSYDGAVMLLVDASGFLYEMLSFSQHPSNSLCHIDYAKLCIDVRNWVKRLRALNVQPVFFFDGVNAPEKRDTQLSRRQNEVKEVEAGFARLINKYSRHTDTKSTDVFLVFSFLKPCFCRASSTSCQRGCCKCVERIECRVSSGSA